MVQGARIISVAHIQVQLQECEFILVGNRFGDSIFEKLQCWKNFTAENFMVVRPEFQIYWSTYLEIH